MGIFPRRGHAGPPHPRRVPEIDLPLTLENLKEFFAPCADFETRPVRLAGWKKPGTLCWIDGMVKSERVNDYVLRPLQTAGPIAPGDVERTILDGVIWNLSARRGKTMDETAGALVTGSCALFLPGEPGALLFAVSTEEKRSVSPPEVETSLKGPKDSFVESLRTNTSLLRRHLATPFLGVEEHIVGRQSHTPVDIVWVRGITDPDLVEKARRRVADIDIDALLATGFLEEYIVDNTHTAFPQVMFTQRPDRFAMGLMSGRVGILVEGVPVGCLLPGNLALFLKAPQDKTYGYMIGGGLTVIRYLCMCITLFLPAFYVAVATFHFEMIPTKLALSIIASKQDVPFVTALEVLAMLVAFEILQEAGLRLPQSVGQTVSIIGGLVVGQSAVEAKIVSPVVVIVVAVAGIAGYTMPDQDFSNALRIWRFLLTVLAALAGLLGLAAGVAGLVYHLAGLESFGVAYLTPFAVNAGDKVEPGAVLGQPLREKKLRNLALHPLNRRRQR